MTIAGGKKKVGVRGFVSEEVTPKELWGPSHGSDERGERGGRGRRHGEDRNKLHRAGFDDDDAAAGGVGQEAGVA